MLTVRPATMADARILFDWRNDPGTRAMSRNSDPVEWEPHRVWLERTLAGTARRLLIVERDGEPIATVRFDYGEETELNITIAPEHRCRGISLKVAKLALAQESECVGYIKAENTSCQRLMRAAGMTLAAAGEMQRWEYRAERANRLAA